MSAKLSMKYINRFFGHVVKNEPKLILKAKQTVILKNIFYQSQSLNR